MDVHGAPLPALICRRITDSIGIDGDLHKAPWSSLEPVWLQPSHGRGPGLDPALAFRQLAVDAPPLDSAIAFQPTALRVCCDEARLYVAFHCIDRDAWGSFEGRNQPIYTEEVVEAFLAPDGDVRRYVELETSPRGAWFEARIESPELRRASMRVDRDWRCAGWRRAVRVRGALARAPGQKTEPDSWWSAEWAIPFASLPGGRAPRPGERWRANFFRIDAAAGGQYSAWSPTFADPPDFHVPDRFGIVEFG
jgi:hypothetical protein